MKYYYFNTNPLLRWAEARAAGSDARCQRIAAEVERLIRNPQNENAISEVTLAEFQSQLHTHERNSNEPGFDPAWADQSLNGVMRWISDGRLTVLETPPKLIERAMAYVRFATREKGLALRAWDAAHLHEASNWARLKASIVYIVTGDVAFSRVMEAFPEFQRFVRVYDPDTQAINP